MKKSIFLSRAILIVTCGIILSSFFNGISVKKLKFPYKHGGLTERQAAAHLLNRFTYGATPGQIDEVVNMGLEKWFEQQLSANLPDDTLNRHLNSYPDINLSNKDVLSQYPQNYVVVQMAIKDSVINKDSVNRAVDKKAYNDQVQNYMKSKGLRGEQDLYKEFISQNILRATYSRNQLQEVMTDFWFNHFNVSFTKNESAQFIPAYERDVIRPNVFGKFDKLLLASAKSPAMLYFLDNFTSVGPPAPAKPAVKAAPKPTVAAQTNAPAQNNMSMMGGDMMMQAAPAPKPVVNAQGVNIAGLNENYAREVMELHTLGVDGGYTQSDVTQAARILTGWTIYPISDYGSGSSMKSLVAKVGESNLTEKGYVKEGDFLFTPTRHDQGEKVVLGRKFPANGGYQEGVDLLEMLAHHPSTAKFISTKLAIRFVSDTPPASLINKMAKTFTETGGDIREVLVTMVSSPEFWDKDALRQKTKSPFELVISSLRSLNADVEDPYQLFSWLSRMGQKIYYYQAPTGFPDRGQYWINTGSLLNRMNFGLALATQKIPGVKVNLLSLNNNHEPESANAALVTYSKLVMPERDLTQTYKQLTPLLNDPNLAVKVTNAAAVTPVKNASTVNAANTPPAKAPVKPVDKNAVADMMAQVVGIIIGSPEFQRR